MIVKHYEHKIYRASECCIFRKTKETYGGLSNMASGFPIRINGLTILSNEALYQACRFPHLPQIQQLIINEKSPMTAKMVSKPHRKNSRIDWEDVKIKIMRWCLRVKLAQNYFTFGALLESTFNRPIVEDSSRDDFWGAIRDKNDPNLLIGTNALGRLLMELRQFYFEKKFTTDMFVVEPLNIADFHFLGKPIERIDERNNFVSAICKSLLINNKGIISSESVNLITQVTLAESQLQVSEPELSFVAKSSPKREKKSKQKDTTTKRKAQSDKQTSISFD